MNKTWYKFQAVTEYETTETYEEITFSQKRLDELCKRFSQAHDNRIMGLAGETNKVRFKNRIAPLQDPLRLSKKEKAKEELKIPQKIRDQFGKLKISITQI